MSERRLDRLLLPRTRADPKGAQRLTPESSDPLPRWQTVPLDAKFPVTPAAKGDVTFITTKIGLPAYRSTQHEGFDLSDPYNQTFKIEYQALCDPNLKHWFAKPYVRKQLMEQNLLTPSGNVTCSIRDFNNYRNYLRRQALIRNRESETLSTRAADKRETILQKTKMKAHLLSLGVKCKGLKAQQMLKETEDEKLRQYRKKQAIRLEREQTRIEEETRAHSELVETKRAKWTKKQNKIRLRQEIIRKHSEMKIVQTELETQQKLSHMDNIRQQKQLLLELKLKEQWQKRREHQVNVLEDMRRQQERVDAEMGKRRRKYEEKMTNFMEEYQAVSADDPTPNTEETERKSYDVYENLTSRISMTIKDARSMTLGKLESDVTLSMRTSKWIVEEVLYGCGLVEDARLLFDTRSPQAYSHVLGKLIGSAVRRRDSASVLGEDQDTLSKIIHLVVRRLKAAYSSEEPRQQHNKEATFDQDDNVNIKRLLEEINDHLKTEKHVYINMCSHVSMSRKHNLDTSLDRGNTDTDNVHTAKLFENHLRLSDPDARQMEGELTQYQLHLQKKSRTMEEEKEILELFLKLACHEPIVACKLRGHAESCDDRRVAFASGNEMMLPSPGSCPCPMENSELATLGTENRHPVCSCCQNGEGDACGGNGDGDMANEIVATNRVTGSRNGRGDEACMLQTDHRLVHENHNRNVHFTTTNEKKSAISLVSELHSKTSAKDLERNGDYLNSRRSVAKSVSKNKDNSGQQSASTDDESSCETEVAGESTATTNSCSSLSKKNCRRGRSQTGTFHHDDLQVVTTTHKEEQSLTSSTESSTTLASTSWSSKQVTPLFLAAAQTDKLSPSSCNDETDESTTSAVSEEQTPISEDKEHPSASDLSLSDKEHPSASDLSQTDKEHPSASDLCLSDKEHHSASDLSQTDKEHPSTSDLSQTDNEVEANDLQGNTEIKMENNMNDNRHTSSPSSAEQEDVQSMPRQRVLPLDKDINHKSVLSGAPPEMTHKDVVLDRPDRDDIVATTARFLATVQQRELAQGVSFPPSRIHNFIAVSLSRLWQAAPGEPKHVSLEGLVTSDVVRTVGRLLSTVKTVQYPPTLIKAMFNAIARASLQKFNDSDRCLPDGVVKSIVIQFFKDLQQGQISIKLLEDVLVRLDQEYVSYQEVDESLAVTLFLCDALKYAEDCMTTGKVRNNDFVENIFDFEKFPNEAQSALINSPWKVLLQQTKVVLELSVVSVDDWTKLEDVVKARGRVLAQQDGHGSIRECMEKITTQQTDEDFKVRSAVTLSANVVAALLETVKGNMISGLALLPCALIPRAEIPSSSLDHSTTGEALVLLILNSLVKDMGEDTLDRQCLGHVAAALEDVFISDYLSQEEILAEGALAEVLEFMTYRFRCKSLEFKDSCKILGTILRTYTSFLLMENKDIGSMLQPGRWLHVDEDLSCLFCFIAEVFVTFVRGITDKITESSVGRDLSDDGLVLCVWRSMAGLAKEAKDLLSDQNESNRCTATSPRLTRPDNAVLEGFVGTLTNKSPTRDPSRAPGHGDSDEPVHTDGTDPHDDRSHLVDAFRRALLQKLPQPGYVPVPSFSIPNRARKSNCQTLESDRNITREEQPDPDIEKSFRREIIIASKQIFESLMTTEALDKIHLQMADYVACAVFVMDRFVAGLYDKIMALKNGLNRGSSPTMVIASFLTTFQQLTLQGINITPEEAAKIVTQVALELEPLHRTISVLCKMVESLSRIGQGLTRVKGHASIILSVVPNSIVALLIKRVVTFAFKSLAWLLNTSCQGQSTAPTQTSASNYRVNVKSTALNILYGGLEFLLNGTKNEINCKRQWTPKGVSGISENSVLKLQVTLMDKVFDQISEVTEVLRTTESDEVTDGHQSPTDLVNYIINQVLGSVTHQTEVGTFPFVRVHDLLQNERSATTEEQGEATHAGQGEATHARQGEATHAGQGEATHARQGEATHASGRNAATRNKSKLSDPVTSLQEEESECVLKQLVHIFTCIDRILKEHLTTAVRGNKSCDSILRASALMIVKLETIKNDMSKKKITLSNFQHGDTDKTTLINARNQFKGNNYADSLKQDPTNLKCSGQLSSTKSDNKMSVTRYISILFQNITDTNSSDETEYVNQVLFIHEILKACYAVGVSCLSRSMTEKNGANLNLESILLVEVMTVELYNRLDEVRRARMKRLDKGTNYPYLFSRTYTTPDPCGPYYSDVVLRARQISDTVTIGIDTRNKYPRLSEDSSFVSDMKGSLAAEFFQGNEDFSSIFREGGFTESEARLGPSGYVDKAGQARVVAWRKRVQDSSCAHGADSSIKSWVKKGTQITPKHSEIKKVGRANSIEGRLKISHQTPSQNAGNLEEKQSGTKDSNEQKRPYRCDQKPSSDEHVDKKSQRNAPFSSSNKNVDVELCRDKHSSSKEATRDVENTNDKSKQQSDSRTKTCSKLNEAATNRHISRMARAKKGIKPSRTSSDAWPKTVHIIHHAYAEQPRVSSSGNSDNNSKAASSSQDHLLMQICPVESADSGNRIPPRGNKETPLVGRHGSLCTHFLVALLAGEMPEETNIISRFMFANSVASLEANSLVDFLSLLDLARIELGQGDEVEAMRILKGEGHKESVSQRAAGAINNVLRSIMTGLIDDEQIQNKVTEIDKDCEKVDIQETKQELIKRLSSMAERVEKGSQSPGLLLGQESSLLEALRDARETTKNVEENVLKSGPDDNDYDNEDDNIFEENSSASQTISCSKDHRSISDVDSNDDKCVISSSWTLLSSCPSLSSSRSSNVARTDGTGYGQEVGTYGHLSEQHPNVEILCQEPEELQQAGRRSTTKCPRDQADKNHLPGRVSGTFVYSEDEEHGGSRAENDYKINDNCQLSWRTSNTDDDPKFSSCGLPSSSNSKTRRDSQHLRERHSTSRGSYKTLRSSHAHSSRGVTDETSPSRASSASSTSSIETGLCKCTDTSRMDSPGSKLNGDLVHTPVTLASQLSNKEGEGNERIES